VVACSARVTPPTPTAFASGGAYTDLYLAQFTGPRVPVAPANPIAATVPPMAGI
jgi:hypothetical protein